MHIPDGLFSAPASVAAIAVAAPTIALAARRAGRHLVDREVPRAGLVTAYLVVSQLLVFPVGLGTSAHLLGAGLALVLVGPSVAITCVSIVVVMQALLFADGGISALGLNALNGGIVPILTGWAVLAMALRYRSGDRQRIALASGAAAMIGVWAAATAFCLEYAVGANATIPAAQVAAGMLGSHLVIGILEGVLTYLLVRALVRIRPDLLARWTTPPVDDRADADAGTSIRTQPP
jgi:cobalt/nickel transport system permease protein